jgi:hypothetical protein
MWLPCPRPALGSCDLVGSLGLYELRWFGWKRVGGFLSLIVKGWRSIGLAVTQAEFDTA